MSAEDTGRPSISDSELSSLNQMMNQEEDNSARSLRNAVRSEPFYEDVMVREDEGEKGTKNELKSGFLVAFKVQGEMAGSYVCVGLTLPTRLSPNYELLLALHFFCITGPGEYQAIRFDPFEFNPDRINVQDQDSDRILVLENDQGTRRFLLTNFQEALWT